MAGETANIAEIANIVANKIFKWFKWEKIPLENENFECHKVDKHAPAKASHSHPVDCVFKYYDPYLNKNILLNTDLKSYARDSITQTKVRGAIKSLAHTIDCARTSTEWKQKYHLDDPPINIRGMLFIYNHDDGYDKNFFSHFKGINLDKLPIQKNQMIHIVDPQRIRYLFTVVKDMESLQAHNMFPKENYFFFYPDFYLHKVHGKPESLPATIEVLSAPYMITFYNEITTYNEQTKETETDNKPGYVLFYNQDGSTEYEFLYLFDTLSRFQILNTNNTIKIRLVHNEPDPSFRSNYQKAINLYVNSWGFDGHKRDVLENIEFETVDFTTPMFMPGELGWRNK